MTIDWRSTQTRLGVKADGLPGPITYGVLTGRVGTASAPVAKALADHARAYGQDGSPARLAEFLAQICNETGGFTTWEENLHYSIEGLMKTWPSRFPAAKAEECCGHANLIAECAYGGRMGNGAEGCGDGYTYRGRGALQLTGRANYAKFGRILGLDLIDHPELAADPYDSTLIALEFFKELGVNAAIDSGDFVKARALTNGGSIGLQHVADLRGKLLAVIA